MDEVKLYIKSIVCITCLSSDRDVFCPTSDEAALISKLEVNMEEDRICWECRAILHKFLKFEQRAVKAQTIMQKVLNGKMNVIDSLSTLKWEVKVDGKRKHYIENESSRILIKDDQSAEPKGDIKTEVDNNEFSDMEEEENEDIAKVMVKLENDKQIGQYEMYDYDAGDDKGDGSRDEAVVTGVQENETHIEAGNSANEVASNEIYEKAELVQVFPDNFDIDDDTTHKLIDTMLETFLQGTVKKKTKKSASLFGCSKCDVKYLNESQLAHHEKTAHKGSFKCKFCGKIFSKSYNLKVHEQIHANSARQTYSCNICGDTYLDSKSVHQHLKDAHDYKFPIIHTRQRSSGSLRDPDDLLVFKKCSICDKLFKSKSAYYMHQKEHSNEF